MIYYPKRSSEYPSGYTGGMYILSLAKLRIIRPDFRGHIMTVVSFGTSWLFVRSLRRDAHVNQIADSVRTLQ